VTKLLTCRDVLVLTGMRRQRLMRIIEKFSDAPAPVRLGNRLYWKVADVIRIKRLATRLRPWGVKPKAVARG
jgi:predicted DNA-binding transcriptional regulator AlpA